MTIFSNLIALLVVLCILVLLHEAGHFFVARAFGIRPYIFSFGIGWRIFGLQKRGDRWRFSVGPLGERFSAGEVVGTDYRVSMIPFGGYVMLQGESLSEEVSGDPREFRTRPRWQQLLVYVAGVALNIILAFGIMTVLIWRQGIVFEEPKGPPVIHAVVPGSGAERAGLRAGDRVLEYEGRDAQDSMAELEEIVYSPGATKKLLIERDGKRMEIQLTVGMDDRYHLGIPGFSTQDRPVVSDVVEGGPAQRAGVRPGDTIVRVDEHESPSVGEIQAILRSKDGLPVHFEIERKSSRLTMEITPEKKDNTPRIGVGFARGPSHEVGLVGAAAESARFCAGNATLLFITIKHLVRGQITPRAMSGPIELAQFSGDRWRAGPVAFIELLAFVSIQLGIMNLLPIPGLDGGHILILLVEGSIRRDLPERLKQWVVTTGFAVLLIFAGVVIWFDILKAAS